MCVNHVTTPKPPELSSPGQPSPGKGSMPLVPWVQLLAIAIGLVWSLEAWEAGWIMNRCISPGKKAAWKYKWTILNASKTQETVRRSRNPSKELAIPEVTCAGSVLCQRESSSLIVSMTTENCQLPSESFEIMVVDRRR